MKEISIEELKKIQLDILLAVHNFCISKGIDYSLAAGTLIGAIRHKGYIPWDDDVDIIMTRPNYDKFIKSFNGTYNHLYVLSPEINWDYYAPYANVCDNRTVLSEGRNGHRGIEVGVKIDVFPIDGAPNNVQRYFAHCKRVYKYNGLMSAKRFSLPSNFKAYTIKLLIYKILSSFFSYSSIQKKINRLATAYDYTKSDLAGQMTFDPSAFRAPRYVFDKYCDIEFEGYKFKVVKDYDLFMTLRYGDYLKLPPEEERVPHHGFTAYWKC